jgi:hypothetical protein
MSQKMIISRESLEELITGFLADDNTDFLCEIADRVCKGYASFKPSGDGQIIQTFEVDPASDVAGTS